MSNLSTLTIFYLLETLLRSFAFVSHSLTQSQLTRGNALGKAILDNRHVDLCHEGIGHLFVQWNLEVFVRVHLDTKVLLDASHGLDALDTAVVQLV